MFTDFLRGVSYVPRGLQMLTRPALLPFVWLPIAINIIIFGGLFWFAGEQYQALLTWLLPDPGDAAGDGWLDRALGMAVAIARWLLWPLFLLAAVVVMFFTFTALANLVGAPFNGWLSARVEQQVTGRNPQDSSMGLVAEILSAFAGELHKLGYFALFGLPLLLLFVVPVLNVTAPFVWGLFGMWVLALEYMDYPLGNRSIGFSDQRRLLRKRRMLHLGFGAGVLAMTVIPVLNLVAMPTAVIAATLLATEHDGEHGDV